MKLNSTSKLLAEGAIKTSSRVKVMWLTRFRGYNVDRVIKHPKHYTFGRLSYDTTYILKRTD